MNTCCLDFPTFFHIGYFVLLIDTNICIRDKMFSRHAELLSACQDNSMVLVCFIPPIEYNCLWFEVLSEPFQNEEYLPNEEQMPKSKNSTKALREDSLDI
jgi:hypothetical protein